MSFTRKRRRREADQRLSSVLCESEWPPWVALPHDVDANTQQWKRKYSIIKEEILKSERSFKPGKSLSQVRRHRASSRWCSPCTARVRRYMQHCSQWSHSLPVKNPSTFRIWDKKLPILLGCELFLKRDWEKGCMLWFLPARLMASGFLHPGIPTHSLWPPCKTIRHKSPS